MVTIRDIAKATGVSATTVSNVIHGKSNRVSAETIQNINDTIKRLGYVPNMSARALVSNSIGKVLTGNFPLKVGNSYMQMSDVPKETINIVKIEVRD